MKLTRNEVKISFNNIDFIVDNEKQTVKCRLYFNVKLPKDLDNEVFFHETEKKFVDSVAVCRSEDVYNENLGKKIALAKAEILAYRKIAKCVKKVKIITGPNGVNTATTTRNIVKSFEKKANRCIRHNIEYIEKVSGKE